MSQIPCDRMICVWASLSVAAGKIKEIDTDEETANSLMLELETAANLAESFNKTWNSIYWNKSSKKTRIRVTRTLLKIAESVFDHLSESIKLFDQLCDEQERFPTLQVNSDWLKVRQSLLLAKEGFEETHSQFIELPPLLKYLKKIEP